MSDICFVAAHGSDLADGTTWQTAFGTLDHAIATKTSEIQVGAGYFPGPSQGVVPNYRKIQGRGDGTVITGGPGVGTTGSVLALGDQMQLSDVLIDGTGASARVPFTGAHLEVQGTSCHVRDVSVQVGDAMENKGTGINGTGLWTHGGEGCLFENLRITHTQLAALVGGANHIFLNLRGGKNFKILQFDPVSSGSHLFQGSKFTDAGWGSTNGVPNGPPVEVIHIGTTKDGDGAAVFILCDWDESYAAGTNIHTVEGDRNEFIRCTTASGCHLNITGNHNRFTGHTCFGTVLCTGSDNEFWDPRNYNPTPPQINGARNLVYGEWNNIGGTGILRLTTTP